GAILFEGQDITHAAQHARVRAGLARSYQITSMFKRFTVLDNLALAVQARSGSSFSFWRPVSEEALLFDEARAIAGEIGLAGREAIVAATLALLQVENLETAYGASQVLFGLELAIRAGEVATLLGRNGMGKTTTVRSIMGLTPARSGVIRFRGERIEGQRPDRIARCGIA